MCWRVTPICLEKATLEMIGFFCYKRLSVGLPLPVLWGDKALVTRPKLV